MSAITDIDRWISVNDRIHIEAAIAVNDAFVALMNRAIRKKREFAVFGIFVDTTPPISAIRIRGTIAMSHCGSPAAMCVESGSDHGGAEAMK